MSDVCFVRNLADLGDRLSARGSRRALILATSTRRFVDEVATALAAFAPTVFDGARVHVPIEVVEAASAALAASGADTIVAVGGGSPIGLGKALRLSHDVRFVALPTTYAGSEMTSMYGITTGAAKQTGRDPRVKPDLVVYDVMFTLELPVVLSVQSLLNSLAHVISALSTDSIAEPATAYTAASLTCAAIAGHVDTTSNDIIALREKAQRGASACAAVFDAGKPGLQHALAHLLGGATRLDHAALHSILLPHFIVYLRATKPALLAELERAIGVPRIDGFVRRVLERAGAPTNLAQLGADRTVVAAAFATLPDLPPLLAGADRYFA
jgi:maleylacetate reductase